MSIQEKLRALSPRIMLVDDSLAAHDMGLVTGADKAKFAEAIEDKAELQSWLCEKLALQPDTKPLASRIIDSDEQLGSLYKIYRGEQAALGWLDPLFQNVAAIHDERSKEVRELSNYLVKHGIDVVPFDNIESAISAFSDCRITFLDLYMRDESIEDMTALYVKHKEALASKYVAVDPNQHRLVILMSTTLPNVEQLEAFRQATGLKSAFFKGADKKDFTEAWLDKFFLERITEYEKAHKVMDYLGSHIESIEKSASEVIDQIHKIEAHDLETLNKLRLTLEGESLTAYLAWLFSESLAAKVRSKESKVTVLDEKDHLPFDGQVQPNDVLFELFSNVVFQYFNGEAPGRAHFGDVFIKKTDADQKELCLVVSPACDLIRCEHSFNVLCVRGEQGATSPSWWDLTSGKKLFGDNRHVMRSSKDQSKYACVTWYPKDARTLPVSELLDATKYVRYGRLGEMFCQEIKESALREFGRVGVQVDPARPEGRSAIVSFNLNGGVETFSADEKLFVSAIVSQGRSADVSGTNGFAIFSTQFRDWMLYTVKPELTRKVTTIPPKIETILRFFEDPKNLTFNLTAKGTSNAVNGTLRVLLLNEAEESTCKGDCCEIQLLTQPASD